MKLRYALAPVLAAFAAGSPARLPRFAEAIPARQDAACDYDGALRSYLLAYAYARERPEVTTKFLAAAENELALCSGEHAVLSERVTQLKSSLP